MIYLVVLVLGLVVLKQLRRARRWLRLREQQNAARLIASNRYRYKPGMDRMDEALRDRTTRRRRIVEESLTEHRKRLESPTIYAVPSWPGRKNGTEE
jgi:hypothetical protein